MGVEEVTRQSIALLFVWLAGCVGDPALVDTDPDLGGPFDRPLEEVERARWEAAEAGCEDVILVGVTLYACEGEPLLGALVDESGDVRCVDAMDVLVEDLRLATPTNPLADDPSPQPSRPGGLPYRPISGSTTGRPAVSTATRAGGFREDPTPTPVVWADPTPTPITDPDRRDPTPTPVVEPEREEEGPAPTPSIPQ